MKLVSLLSAIISAYILAAVINMTLLTLFFGNTQFRDYYWALKDLFEAAFIFLPLIALLEIAGLKKLWLYAIAGGISTTVMPILVANYLNAHRTLQGIPFDAFRTIEDMYLHIETGIVLGALLWFFRTRFILQKPKNNLTETIR